MDFFFLLELVYLMLHVELQNIMMVQIIVYLAPQTVLPVPITQEIVKLVSVLSLFLQVSPNNVLV
jgi:CRISPR/Cas system-associated exonuclease Cas4 (RecB family)